MRRLVAAVLGAAAMACGAPGPATAATVATAATGATTATEAEVGRVQVRLDGTDPWSDDLAHPLFARTGRLVPTDRVTGRFEVRNDSPTLARASLAVVSRGPANALTRTLQIGTDVGGQHSQGTWTLGQQGTCRTLVTGPDIPPGGHQPVSVSLDFPDVDGTTAARTDAALEVVVRLTEVGPEGTVDICGVQAEASACRADVAVVPLVGEPSACPRARTAPVDGSLASTGAARGLGSLLVAGTMLFVTGGWLVLRAAPSDAVPAGDQRRRRRRGGG